MSFQEQDVRCLERITDGDSRALRELYDRYGALLYPVAHRILGNAADAEDAVQRTWVQVWRTSASYDPRRGVVAAWLLTMVRSRALDLVRSLSSRRRAEEAVDPEPASPAPDPSDSADRRNLRERVRAALDSLAPSQRQVLEIAYFEGLSQSQIAERLGTPLGTIKSWTRQGLQRLKEILPKEEWL